MTEAPPREPAAPPRGLRRSSEGRFLMGVCAGLGRHTGIDPVVFRVAFAVLLLGSGIGIFLYIAAFLLMKEPNGGPGIIEQWTRRDFDAEAVMALLTAVLGFGLALNLATVWLDTGTLVVGVLLAVSLLAAHASGVDLLGLARSMPERLSRRRSPDAETPPPSYAPPEPAPPVRPAEPTWSGLGGTATAHPESAPPAAPPAPAPTPRTTAAAHAEAVAARLRAMSASRQPDAARTDENEPPRDDADRPEMTRIEAAQAMEAASKVTAQHEIPEDATRQAQTPQAPQGPQPEAPRTDASRAEATARQAASRQEPPAYRPQPRTAVDYSGYGEPFAPKGPYRPLDPARRGGYSPYDPALYGRPVPGHTPPKRRPKSFIGAITILLAIIVGGIVVAVQARSAAGVSPTIVGGAVLITIGAGLLIAAWWGRGAGLVALGTTVALMIGAGLMLGGLPRNIGDSTWYLTTPAEASKVYDVGLGDGRLDLTELKMQPGTRLTFDARVSVGELTVIVPPTARVEVHAVNKIGDIKIDQSTRGGVDIRFDKVLEPEIRPDGEAATIVLNLRGGLGDMEVRRGA
ncbi:PspC domain-containing protein [Nonomuraea spiralis]|uniref:PspC domain-containing protein n=1 Tax=Nonomuraea spiralis TaxID=46182 RepID=A0ABV5IR23_9ACTN|nr:PspC domain-containing protein [Nonomuraea spiralis]